jgi:FdhE protein
MPKKKKSDTEAEKVKKRVEAMIKERPSHKEVLRFFGDVVSEQYTIRSKVKTAPIEVDEEDFKNKIVEGFPLVEKKALTLDVPSTTRLFKRLCKIISRNKKASHHIERITQALRNKEIDLMELFKRTDSENGDYITALSNKLGVKEDILLFLARSSVKPIFEAYAKELGNHVDQGRWWRGYCPICGSEPFMAEFRNEGETEGGVAGARFLVCSSCGYEWRFSRLKCPFCENANHEKLRYFYAEKEGKAYRIDVCDNCKRYIKTVDTNELGEEVIPIIEDAGTLYLDILAQKEGYTKEGMSSKLTIDA